MDARDVAGDQPKVIELYLPLPPSANRIWRSSRGRVHKSSEYQKWLEAAGWEAKAQRPGTIKGPYILSISMVRPSKRRLDLDNRIKPTSDLLTSIGVIEDDSYAEMITIRWVTGGEGMTVRIQEAKTE